MEKSKSILAQIKKNLITLCGLRRTFKLKILGQKLNVDYNLRHIKPDRDYSIILQLVKDKKCFLDIGANHGIISLLAAKVSNGISIHAFEASEDAVNIINRNIQLNNLISSIKVVNTLIADRSGYTIPFYWEGSSGGASIVKGRLGHIIEIHKSTLSLDDYVKYYNLNPDFIKMDIEGAENIAIIGMKEILKHSRPVVFIELHSFGDKKLYQNASDILKFVSEFNYMMLYLRNGQPITNPEILADRGRCHVLLMPNEKYHTSYFDMFDLTGL